MLRDLEAYEAKAALMPSPLKLGDWLSSTFGSEILADRRARERAAAALERGLPVVIEAVASFKDRPVTDLQAPEAPASAPAPAPAPPHVPAAAHAPAPARTTRRLPPVAVVAAIAVVAAAAAAVVLAAR
jgi:hypothetical protein